MDEKYENLTLEFSVSTVGHLPSYYGRSSRLASVLTVKAVVIRQSRFW